MTYVTKTEAEADDLQIGMFGDLCAQRGVDPAKLAAGEATLDALNGVPVYPPVTTHFLDVAPNVSEVLVFVNPVVEAYDGDTLADANGDPFVVDLGETVPFDELTEAEQQAILKAAKVNAESKPPVKP